MLAMELELLFYGSLCWQRCTHAGTVQKKANAKSDDCVYSAPEEQRRTSGSTLCRNALRTHTRIRSVSNGGPSYPSQQQQRVGPAGL